MLLKSNKNRNKNLKCYKNYTDVDTDWFKVFLGAMMLIAVVFNNYIRRKVTESK